MTGVPCPNGGASPWFWTNAWSDLPVRQSDDHLGVGAQEHQPLDHARDAVPVVAGADVRPVRLEPDPLRTDRRPSPARGERSPAVASSREVAETHGRPRRSDLPSTAMSIRFDTPRKSATYASAGAS